MLNRLFLEIKKLLGLSKGLIKLVYFYFVYRNINILYLYSELKCRRLKNSVSALNNISKVKIENIKKSGNINLSNTNNKLKILFIDYKLLMPDKDAGSLTALNILNIFIELGYDVTFAAADKSYKKIYYEKLTRMGIRVLVYPEIISLGSWLKENGNKIDIIWCSRAPVLNYYFDIIKRYARDAKLIFYTVDVHYIRAVREARLLKNKVLLNRARKIKKYEIDLASKSDATIVLSDFELNILRSNEILKPVVIIPLIYKEITGSLKSFNERKDILFVGGFDHEPNRDAVKYFVEEIFPKVMEKLRDVKFRIVGSNPTKEILEMSKYLNVKVVGYVENLSYELQNARINVSPLRFGAGLKGKIGISMCNGLPSVVTNIAAEGMGLQHNENALIANDADKFADHIIDLYENVEMWEKISVNSYKHTIENFSYEAAREKIKELHNYLFAYCA